MTPTMTCERGAGRPSAVLRAITISGCLRCAANLQHVGTEYRTRFVLARRVGRLSYNNHKMQMAGSRRPSPNHSRRNGAAKLSLRPEHALVAGDDVADALVDEFLDALTFPGLGRVDVALGVGRDRVHAVELAGLAAAVAEGG